MCSTSFEGASNERERSPRILGVAAACSRQLPLVLLKSRVVTLCAQQRVFECPRHSSV
jgi:hypothetical protein